MSPDAAIDRILEFSAEAHTKRREASENSPAFYRLTGAILAYGKALDLLARLRKDCMQKKRTQQRDDRQMRIFRDGQFASRVR
jgi:hypothetical protein